MSKVRVAGFGVSLDGFGAGIEQSLEDPLGKRGPEMFQWFFHTTTFCSFFELAHFTFDPFLRWFS